MLRLLVVSSVNRNADLPCMLTEVKYEIRGFRVRSSAPQKIGVRLQSGGMASRIGTRSSKFSSGAPVSRIFGIVLSAKPAPDRSHQVAPASAVRSYRQSVAGVCRLDSECLLVWKVTLRAACVKSNCIADSEMQSCQSGGIEPARRLP